jgi:hypothetical protein
MRGILTDARMRLCLYLSVPVGSRKAKEHQEVSPVVQQGTSGMMIVRQDETSPDPRQVSHIEPSLHMPLPRQLGHLRVLSTLAIRFVMRNFVQQQTISISVL